MANKKSTLALTDELKRAGLKTPELLQGFTPGFDTVKGDAARELPDILTPEAAEVMSEGEIELLERELSSSKRNNVIALLTAIGSLAFPPALLAAPIAGAVGSKRKKQAQARVKGAEERAKQARDEDFRDRELASQDALRKAQISNLEGGVEDKSLEWSKAANTSINQKTRIRLDKMAIRKEYLGVPTEIPLPTALVMGVMSEEESVWARANNKANADSWQVVNPGRARIKQLRDLIDSKVSKSGRSEGVYARMLKIIRSGGDLAASERAIAEEYLDFVFLDAIEWAKKYRGLGRSPSGQAGQTGQ